MGEKRDWVKTIAIILAIVFFIFWLITSYDSTNQQQTTQDVATICNTSIQNTIDVCQMQYQNLHTQWQIAFASLKNCYEQGSPECNYIVPTLNGS
ncbi:MAG: hypothetical protein AABW51_02945 [Nanoarchaeota archaeon]